jgi:hypothetical protein
MHGMENLKINTSLVLFPLRLELWDIDMLEQTRDLSVKESFYSSKSPLLRPADW